MSAIVWKSSFDPRARGIPDAVSKDVFVHIFTVAKAGFSSLAEGAKVNYEIVSDRGKESAGNLRL
jgi:cold shock protein